MPIHSIRSLVSAACAALLWLAAGGAGAHGEARSALPEGEGLQVGGAAALSWLRAPAALPSQALPGYLLLGDPGVDARGRRVEHGTLELGWRADAAWSAEAALGVHDSDPVHVETAWLQRRGVLASVPGSTWTLGAGRRGPALGATVGAAGHLDRFGPMPLAKHAAMNGDWIDDGIELGLQQPWAGVDWTLGLGAWRGRSFPGSRGAPAAPGLHLGAARDTAAGDWMFDAFIVQLKPPGRGSRLVATTGGHSHTAPVCDASLQAVVCFGGRARVAGISAQWTWPAPALTLAGALLWRDDDGLLQSRDGVGNYQGRVRGGWAQLLWNGAAGWDAGLRLERLAARQGLAGPGATLVAAEAGLGAYAPQRRSTATVGWAVTDWATWRLEAGRESADNNAVNFFAVRLLLQWATLFARTGPTP
jgi:hypothetical protein